jgi:preprotein translocase subunit SecD
MADETKPAPRTTFVYLSVFVFSTVLLLSGCAIKHSPPAARLSTADVEFRRAQTSPCAGCEVKQDPEGTTIYLQPGALFTGSDIAEVSRSFSLTGMPSVTLAFRPESQAKIEAATSAVAYERSQNPDVRSVAWVADGKVLMVATLTGPFSTGMEISGAFMSVEARDAFYDKITVTPPR